MKITVEMDELEFKQFLEWRQLSSASAYRVAKSMISTPIAEAELTNRTKNALIAAGFSTVADAQVKTDEDLLKTTNLGRKGLCEFRELYPIV